MRRDNSIRAGGDGNVAARDTNATSSRSDRSGRSTPSPSIPSSADDVETCVRALSRDDLAVLWQRRWRRPPPKGLSRRLLEGNAGWLLQAEASGGLTAETRRRLDALARSNGSGEEVVNDAPPAAAGAASGRLRLRPGSRLIRQWQGRSHVVEVIKDGFIYDGQQFTSLTAIARTITGAHWSGPRFFGLNATTAGGRQARSYQNPPERGRQTVIPTAHEDQGSG
ncbi:DUF2924 domain-containing protein [Minwuia thermotolerans]|uniref:DUF2924 domain-containing protein n=1 Tax=Minwuia thermotolerans TaxID=2056226 RepID=A0A2M9FZC6_9PROT|nr:DUF2924 domain-containing protein [Minwuia thermotolerans]PJK28822.1 hypothetical protein CVT23_15960 [Minwuia thermotolerans]